MATPTLLSVSNVTLPNAADSGNVAVTIPTGANACVIGGTYYVSDSSVITSITGSVFSATTNGALRVNNPTSGTYMGTYAAAFKVTATGSQTVRVQKTGVYSEGPTCQIGWFTVDDADNFVRTGGFVVVQQTASPQALAATVNSNSTDYVFGLFGTDGSSADPSAPTGTTLRGTMQTTQFDKSIAFSANTVGASTTSVTAGSRDFPTLSLIALTAGGGGATTHAATGALVGPGAVVAGTAARTRAHGASGALSGPGSTVVGSARHNVPHSSSGALVGPGAVVSGAAARANPAVSHDATGALVGPGSALNGHAQLGDSIIDTHDGFWVREWKKMVEREKKLTVEEVMEIVEEAPKEVLEAIPEVKKQVKKEFGRVDYQRIANNLQMQRFIAEQILVRHEISMQELEDDDLEVLLLL